MPQESKLGLAEQYGRFWRWGRRPRFTFYLGQWYWNSYPFSRRVSHRPLMKHCIPCASREFKGMWSPLTRWGGNLWLSLGSPQWIQTCLHLVRWKTSLNLSQCREIVPAFKSGPLGVHSTWDRKHRVSLTYLLLREYSSWGACGKLANIFSQRQGISSHLGMIWCAWSFPRVAVLKLIYI